MVADEKEESVCIQEHCLVLHTAFPKAHGAHWNGEQASGLSRRSQDKIHSLIPGHRIPQLQFPNRSPVPLECSTPEQDLSWRSAILFSQCQDQWVLKQDRLIRVAPGTIRGAQRAIGSNLQAMCLAVSNQFILS